MKVFVFFALVVCAYGASVPVEPLYGNTAYGYLERYGVPLAEKIRAAEENADPSTRIVGGSAASAAQFPWQAGLISDIVGLQGNGVCGASLLNANRALTAAHCWFDGQNQAWRFTVVLGTVTLFTGGQRHQTSNIAVHPNWFPLLVRNDIAVIRLTNNVAFSTTIQPIALPSGSQLNELFTGEIATASGFGLTADGAGISANQFLSHVQLQVIANNICSLTYPIIVQASNICTSGLGGRGTCQGDSGGPLTVVRSGRPILIGVTSFGSPQGCQSGNPAAFARVTSFISFINSNM